MSKGTKAVSIFGGAALMLSLAACGGSEDADSARVDTPKSLVGTWYQTNKLDSGVMMQAQVYRNGTIQVDMRSGDGSHSHYWMGSFPSHRNPNTNFKVTSKADSDAQKVMAGSIFGSQATSKRFKYLRGDLSFEFKMMGTTSTIHLRQPYKFKTPTAKATPSITVPNMKAPGTTKSTPKTVAPAAPKAPAAKAPSTKK